MANEALRVAAALSPRSPRTAPEHRIDELARLAGTTVRNVRAYQDRGLLPPPRRVGRVGLYSETHLARLRLIGTLLGRGYTLGNIGELIAGWEQGRDLGELLGLETALIAPWSDEEPSTVLRADVEALVGKGAAGELLAGAERLGLVSVEGDVVRASNPRMLEGAAVLISAGVPTAAVLELGAHLAASVDEIAGRYVELAERHLLPDDPGSLPDRDVHRLTELIERLRPLAKQVVTAELAVAMERRIRAEMGERFGRGAVTPPG